MIGGAVGTDDSDTVTYATSTAVNVNLVTGTGQGGLASGDTLTEIENLIGAAHNDRLTGDGEANMLAGAGGNDTLVGGDGADSLNGGTGNDFLAAGNGDDTLEGGDGHNTFVFGPGFGKDTIDGFKLGQDAIQLSSSVFPNAANLASAIGDDGFGNARFTVNANNTITFMGVSANDLKQHTSDFHIA